VAELDEMISSILKDPQSMQMVSSLLAGLGGEKGETEKTAADPPALPIDLAKLTPVLMKLNGPPDERCKLLLALRPFVSPSRQARIDQSVKLLKMMSLADQMGGLGIV